MAKKSTTVKTVTLADLKKKPAKGQAIQSTGSALFQKKGDARLEKLEKQVDKRGTKSIKKNIKKIEKLTR